MKFNRFGKKISTTAHNIARSLEDTETSKRRDFAWSARKSNPMFSTQRKKDWGLWIKIICIITAGAATILIMVSHAFFEIKEVKIVGINRIDTQEINNTVNGILNENKFGFFSGRNYFLANATDIKDILMLKYPIAEIVVMKVYPNNLSIELKEKINRIIFDNGRRFAYLNESGQVLEIIRSVGEDEWETINTPTVNDFVTPASSTSNFTTTTPSNILSTNRIHKPDTTDLNEERENCPILYDARLFNTTTPSLEKGIEAIDAKYIKAVISWHKDLTRAISREKIDYFELQNDLGFGIVQLHDGSFIKINLLNEPSSAVEAIEMLLSDKIKGKKFEYIDVRFPGRIYWK